MDFKEFQAFGRTNPVFLAVGHELHELAGWQANVPAMFGFERLHCLTTKFYGVYCSSATATYA